MWYAVEPAEARPPTRNTRWVESQYAAPSPTITTIFHYCPSPHLPSAGCLHSTFAPFFLNLPWPGGQRSSRMVGTAKIPQTPKQQGTITPRKQQSWARRCNNGRSFALNAESGFGKPAGGFGKPRTADQEPAISDQERQIFVLSAKACCTLSEPGQGPTRDSKAWQCWVALGKGEDSGEDETGCKFRERKAEMGDKSEEGKIGAWVARPSSAKQDPHFQLQVIRRRNTLLWKKFYSFLCQAGDKEEGRACPFSKQHCWWTQGWLKMKTYPAAPELTRCVAFACLDLTKWQSWSYQINCIGCILLIVLGSQHGPLTTTSTLLTMLWG